MLVFKFNVPPSDISQSVRRLETELGVKLFTRSANRISVNEKGREAYGYFSRALKIVFASSRTFSVFSLSSLAGI